MSDECIQGVFEAMNRRERKKEETRANIIDCAIDLFKEKGFQETSMEEIAESADVSKGTLYNYFQDKGSILIAYFQSMITGYGKEINTTPDDSQGIKARLNQLLDFKNRIFGDDMELTAFYFRYRLQSFFEINPFDNPNRSGLEKVVLEIINEAQAGGEIRNDMPALVIARTFQLLTANYFMSSIYAKSTAEIDDLKDQLIGLFLNGAKR